MPVSLETALLRAVDALEREHLRYAVIGGLALANWGVVRATRDIDFKVAVPDTEYRKAKESIARAFPHLARPGLPDNPLIVSVLIDGVIADFLLAIPGYDTEVVERAVSREVGGRPVWFAAAEDLVIQKVVAGRERDWLDVEALLEANYESIDLEFISTRVQEFSDALEQPAIVARFRELLRRSFGDSSPSTGAS